MPSQENKQKILNALANKNFVKIISGIQNYDKQKSLNVAMGAEMGGATALDLCDNPEIIKSIRALVQLPIFVSSIDPLKLIAAQSFGVDALEVGNYEGFYKQGKMFTPKEILEIAKFVKKSITKDLLISVTIPATLEIENQIKLAKELITLGVDIIQTEGFDGDTPSSDRRDQTYSEILQSASTLANTLELRKALPKTNIITASGITLTTTPFALASGANGVGIGTYINLLTTQAEMTERVKELMDSINQSSVSHSLSSTKTLALQV